MAGDNGEPNSLRSPQADGAAADASMGWREKLESEYRRIKEHVETYPYVWGSYILVYGGLGAYLAIRWRKLRRTEDRVRILQGRLCELVEAEEAAARTTAQSGQSQSAPPSTLTLPRPTEGKSNVI